MKPKIEMTKTQAAEMLKQARALLKEQEPEARFDSCYIRTMRRDLGEAYKIMHPGMERIQHWNWWRP
jgi:hypothetical protein